MASNFVLDPAMGDMPALADQLSAVRCIRTFAACLLVLLTLLPPGRARAADELTVTVSGTGASADEARTDAVRQALQQAISQLVIVERVVSNDRLVRDNVMSTMNGYVDRFHQLTLKQTPGGFVLEAEVTVSASRIENFVGVTSGGGAPVEGMSLLAESGREIAQRKARGEILDRLFRGFPADTNDIKILSIAPSSADPSSLAVKFSYNYKPTFVVALTDTLRALSLHECQKIARADRRFAGMTLQQLANASIDDRWCLQQFDVPATATHDVACLGFATEIDCYALQKGDYCVNCRDDQPASDMRLVAFAMFVDAAGHSVMTDQQSCLVQLATPMQAEGGAGISLSRRSIYFSGMFNIAESQWEITVPRSAVDLTRAQNLVMLPGILGHDAIIRYEVLAAANRLVEAQHLLREKTMLSLVPGESRDDSCDSLEAVAQAVILAR